MGTFRLDPLVQTILRRAQILGCAEAIILALRSLRRHFVFSFLGNSFDTNVKQQRVSWVSVAPFTDWVLKQSSPGRQGPVPLPSHNEWIFFDLQES